MFGNKAIFSALRKRRTDVRFYAVASHLRQATELNELLYIVASDEAGYRNLDHETLRETVSKVRAELTAALAIVSNQQAWQ